MKDKKMTKIAKRLRKNMTDAEKLLWSKIRNRQLGVKFRRQQPVGRYIVDFICFEEQIIIEVDGGQHSQNKEDEIRDKWFMAKGFKVLRFWNNDVLRNVRGVVEDIREELLSPSLNPSRQGRETSSPLKGEDRGEGEGIMEEHPPLIPPVKGGKIGEIMDEEGKNV